MRPCESRPSEKSASDVSSAAEELDTCAISESPLTSNPPGHYTVKTAGTC